MPSNGLAFRSNGLLMPGLMWEPGASEIKSALETVIVADVEDWWNQKFWADILGTPWNLVVDQSGINSK